MSDEAELSRTDEHPEGNFEDSAGIDRESETTQACHQYVAAFPGAADAQEGRVRGGIRDP
jgi:hypothetical protein